MHVPASECDRALPAIEGYAIEPCHVLAATVGQFCVVIQANCEAAERFFIHGVLLVKELSMARNKALRQALSTLGMDRAERNALADGSRAVGAFGRA